jgi:hypothetical protein
MFGHHRDADFTLEEPDTRIGEGRTDTEVSAELTDLDADTRGVNE